MTDNLATERILLGSTSPITCKMGPTPFIITSLTLHVGDKTIGVDNTPTALKGTAAPGKRANVVPMSCFVVFQ